MESSGRRSTIQLAVCTLVIFLLRPASGVSVHFNSDNDQRNTFHSDASPEVLNTNSIDSAGPSDDGSLTIPESQILKTILLFTQMMGRQAELLKDTSDKQDSKPVTTKDMETTPVKDEFTQTDSHSEIPDSLLQTIIPHSSGDFPSLPSPTPATPTTESLKDTASTPRLEGKMSVTDNGNNDDNESGNIDNSKDSPAPALWNPFDAASETSDDHLNDMWTSSLPILINNNKASLFSKPGFDDMSKIFPVLPTFLRKINEVHKPGHITIMMMNPNHTLVNTEVVKKTNICCEMRQTLLHTKKNVPTDDQTSPSSPDDEVSPELQSFITSLLQHHIPEVPETSSFEDDHKGVSDADSPWCDEEKSLVSHIINHLHLFDHPDHLSAVSFNPRHIVQNKNAKLLHIRIRIHLPIDGSSDSSGFNSPLVDGNNDTEPVYPVDYQDPEHVQPVDYNTDDTMEPMPPLSPSSFKQSEKISKKLKIHYTSRLTVHEYPLDNFSDGFELPAVALSAPIKASKKRMTIFYFIIHHHPKEQSTPATNTQTLLRDIFNIPSITSPSEDFGFPQEDDSYKVPQEFNEDPFRGDSESIHDVLSHLFSPNDNSGLTGENSPHIIPPSESLPAQPFKTKDTDMHPVKDEFTQTDSHSEIPDSLLKIIIPHSSGDFPSLPSPTHTTPTKKNLDYTRMRIQVKMSVNDNGSNDDKGSDNIENYMDSPANYNPLDAATEPSDDHLNDIWTSILPILIKNNKASLFSKPDFDDMSKILPVLPTFLNKLNEVHKHGHLTIMMMNPKHMPVDTEVVDKTHICCEMRQQLLHTMKNVPTDDQPSPPLPDDEVSPELQSFFTSLLQHHIPEEPETSSFEDDHQGVNDADSPWDDKEKSLVSHIINHLHLFDQPDHLSAVSFNPRHIVQKKNPTLRHIRIRIHLPTEGSSDSSVFNSPLFNGNDDPEPVNPVDYNTDDTMEPMPPLSPSSFKEPDQLYNKLKSHRTSRLTVHEYPLENLSGGFEPPAEPLPAPLKTPKKRMAIFHFIIHDHPKLQSTPAPNLQTLVRDIFNIPFHTSSSEDFVFPQEDDSYRGPQNFHDVLARNDNLGLTGEDSPHSMPPAPLDILNNIIKGVNLFPEESEDQFSNQVPENGLPSDDLFPGHITHMRIIPNRQHQSDDKDAFEKFMG